VIDKEKNIEMPYRIYMNNVLDYRGYRFFQASYDQDEQGTILSVNKDPGKIPTYLGYFLLSFGFLWNLFNKKSRFRKLDRDIHQNTTFQEAKIDDKRVSKEVKTKVSKAKIYKSLLFLALICLQPANQLIAQENSSKTADAVNVQDNANSAKKHSELFGTILTQSMDGRIYPVDTIAHEILNKVHRKDSYDGMNANQVLFAMLTNPIVWQNKPFIRVSHPELKKLIGIEGSYASYSDFFDAKTDQYKLKQVVEIAERKKDAEKNQFDKDVIKVDERLNIVFSVFNWDILRIVPKIDDTNNRWYSINSALSAFAAEESDNIRILFGAYFDAVDKASVSGNWTNADKIIEAVKGYQKKYGNKVMPSDTRIEAEIFFNKAKIFDRIYPIYLLSGFILLLFIFAKMAAPKLNMSRVVKAFFVINLFTFIIHTAGLALRWYVANHAPWSNSYESMIYIAWAIALAGLFFARVSVISTALAYINAGIMLFTAHLSWLDPHITNLMPVLKSHWLTIHVSVITASYGFLGLCSLLGFFALILFIARCFSKNKDEIERNITEAVKINEMSMILGLSLLTVGNFLGGVWANESWGRYWGWDPKETWALISILIYAAVTHFRFIPKLNNQFAFSIASTLSYASIIMTYFGVNFYLSGMHSYASGDPVPVPTFVWYILAVLGIVIAISAYSVVKLNKQGNMLKRL
jgi:cytochrome c-type biogenesis protein CcsB